MARFPWLDSLGVENIGQVEKSVARLKDFQLGTGSIFAPLLLH